MDRPFPCSVRFRLPYVPRRWPSSIARRVSPDTHRLYFNVVSTSSADRACSNSLISPSHPSPARSALHASSDTLFWDSYHALDYALVGFRNSLPPLSSLPSPQAPGRRAVGSSGSDSGSSYSTPPAAYEAEERGHTLLFAHIASLTAVMHVHDIFANRDESERWIVLRAAGDVVATVHTAVSRPGMCLPGACVLDPRKTHMLIGVSIRPIAFVPASQSVRR